MISTTIYLINFFTYLNYNLWTRTHCLGLMGAVQAIIIMWARDFIPNYNMGLISIVLVSLV